MVRRALILRSPNPSPDRHVAHTQCLPDGIQREALVVRLQREPDALLGRLAEHSLRGPHCVEKGIRPRLILHKLRGTAHPAARGRSTHGCAPASSAGAGTALARRVGTWNDPTRVSLGQGMHGVSLRSMVCDLPVAHSAVNVDRCSPCSRTIVLSTLRSPTGRTVEYSQCCHFSTYTRRNRQVPVSEPPMPSRSTRAQPGVKPDRRTASLNPTRTAANAENSRGEH